MSACEVRPATDLPKPVQLDDLPSAWTLMECIAWIMLRDPAVVRDTASETARKGAEFVTEHRLPNGEGIPVLQTGEAGNRLRRLVLLAAFDKEANPDAEMRPISDVKAGLLEALRAGRISAAGTRKSGDDHTMQPRDWRGVQLVEQGRFDLHAEHAATGAREWRNITIPKIQVVENWPPHLDEALPAPLTPTKIATDHSGAAGRPTSKHLVQTEYLRRAEAGEACASITEEGKALSAWLSEAHRHLARMTPGTVENAIRSEFNRRRGPTKL